MAIGIRRAGTVLLVLAVLSLIWAAAAWDEWRTMSATDVVSSSTRPLPSSTSVPDPYAYDGEWISKLVSQIMGRLGATLLVLGVVFRVWAHVLMRRKTR